MRETGLHVAALCMNQRQVAMGRGGAPSISDLPESVQALLLLTEIRCLAQETEIDIIEVKKDRLKCRRANAPQKYIKTEGQFPRLTNGSPLLKLQEIKQYVNQVKN